MKSKTNNWAKFNELVTSPISLLVLALGYYLVFKFWGPEAGLMPPGYFTNVLAGAAIMHISGFMASYSLKFNKPTSFLIVFDPEKIEGEISFLDKALASCEYFAFYALSIWALTSML